MASNGWVNGSGMVTAAKIIAWINIAVGILVTGFPGRCPDRGPGIDERGHEQRQRLDRLVVGVARCLRACGEA